jgi:hypothetical protein
MSFSRVVTLTLWFVPLLLLAAIAVVMFRRKLVRRFPIFFTYTVLVFSREVVVFFLPYPGNLYSLVWFCGEALAVLLGLGVIVETLKHVIPAHPFLKLVLQSVWILGVIAAATAILMLLFATGTGADPAFEWIILTERSARFLQVCLLIAVIALMSRLGLTWRHYSIGIVAGFGIYSALDLVVLEFRAHLHFIGDAMFVLLKPAAYNLAAVIWALYFLPSGRTAPVERLPKTNLEAWKEAVDGYVNQWYRRS